MAQHFRYLGNIEGATGNVEREVKQRIAKGVDVFNKPQSIWE